MFRKIKGQDQTIELLKRAIENDRISQSYLFHGGDGVGKFMTALYFGMALNCVALPDLRPCGQCDSCHKFLSLEHPDLTYLFPTPKLDMSVDGEIKKNDALSQYQAYLELKRHQPWEDFAFKESVELRKENINLLMKRLELSIHEARYRIVIIEQADMMNIQTANAFLKTLEEPPANTVIIMISERIQMLLPTIISRTQPVYFKPLSREAIENILTDQFDADPASAHAASRVSAGNLKAAIRAVLEHRTELQDLALDLLAAAAKDQDIWILELLDKKKDYLSRDRIQDLIKHLRLLASDLSLLALDDTAEVVHLDKLKALQDIATQAGDLNEGQLDYLLGLEELSRKLDGNANPALVLYNLFLNTKRWLNIAL